MTREGEQLAQQSAEKLLSFLRGLPEAAFYDAPMPLQEKLTVAWIALEEYVEGVGE